MIIMKQGIVIFISAC